jgi:deferrochelatase/peroxidase EfeB
MIDREQAQDFVVNGSDHDFARHLFLRIDDVAETLDLLRELIPLIALWDGNAENTNHPKISFGCNVGGLVKLGVPLTLHSYMEKTSPAFTEGAYARAGRQLGDAGKSAPAYWGDRFHPDNLDIVLSVHALDETQAADTCANLRELKGAVGLSGWDTPFDSAHLTQRLDRREHFGFRDGISQPSMRGMPNVVGAPPHMITQPGEFILGYENDCGENLWNSTDDNEASRTAQVAFFRNGSFAVVRAMEQDVQGFKDNVARQRAELPEEAQEEMSDEFLAAKMCGRWQNGALIKPGELSAPEELPENLNDFDFKGDTGSSGCPFNSHIRRLNDRTPTGLAMSRRMLLRRGMPYGPEVGFETLDDDIQPDTKTRTVERGLFGVFVCADLQHQFEYIMKQSVSQSDGSAITEIEIEKGIEAWSSVGAVVKLSYYQSMLAEALLLTKDTVGTLQQIDTALEMVEGNGEGFFHAEILQIRSEILALQDDHLISSDCPAANFRNALAIAQVQNARGLELRALTSLVRNEQRLGQPPDLDRLARLLQSVDSQSQNADVVRAKSLLPS